MSLRSPRVYALQGLDTREISLVLIFAFTLIPFVSLVKDESGSALSRMVSIISYHLSNHRYILLIQLFHRYFHRIFHSYFASTFLVLLIDYTCDGCILIIYYAQLSVLTSIFTYCIYPFICRVVYFTILIIKVYPNLR